MIRAVCVGGANIDRKIRARGTILRGTSNPADVFTTFGGVARNIAENLGRMEVVTSLLTLVGDDASADLLLTHCAASGVIVSDVRRLPGERTASYTAILSTEGELLAAFADMDLYERFRWDYLREHWPMIRSAEALVLDTNLPASVLARALTELREVSRPYVAVVCASVPKVERLPQRLDRVDLLVMNRDEAEAATGVRSHSLEHVWMAAEELRQRGARRVVVTLGKEGVIGVDEQGSVVLPPEWVEVHDVTGAGDALAAGLVYTWLAGAVRLDVALRFGLRIAAFTCQTPHSVHPMLSEIHARAWLEALNQHPPTEGA